MCEFCRSLYVYKQADEISRGVLRREYSVALIKTSYEKGHKKDARRFVDYRRAKLGYELNYCPECGRKI